MRPTGHLRALPHAAHTGVVQRHHEEQLQQNRHLLARRRRCFPAAHACTTAVFLTSSTPTLLPHFPRQSHSRTPPLSFPENPIKLQDRDGTAPSPQFGRRARFRGKSPDHSITLRQIRRLGLRGPPLSPATDKTCTSV
jgi:hypothetical protein